MNRTQLIYSSFAVERVMDSWIYEGRRMRVETIIEEEELMSASKRTDHKCHPRYLQVLRPAGTEDSQQAWAGVSGQITKSTAVMEKEMARVEEKVDVVAASQEKLIEETAELKAMIALLVQQTKTAD